MKRFIVSSIAAAAVTLSMGAHAFSFTYIDYAVGNLTFDGSSNEFDYDSLSASLDLPLLPMVLVETTNFENLSEDSIGLGASIEIANSNIYGIIHYVDTTNDESEIRLTGGVRIAATNHLEVALKVRNDVTHDDDDSGIESTTEVSLAYHFNDYVSLAGNYEFFDNGDITSISGRFSF